jgi:hypothetical protein
MRAYGGVFDAFTLMANLKLRIEIGQVKEPSRDSDGQPLTGIEAEKPHARFPAGLYIRPQIEFRKSVQSRDIRHQARRHALHGERDGTHVRMPVEQIQFEPAGYQTAKGPGLHSPVPKSKSHHRIRIAHGRAGTGQGL